MKYTVKPLFVLLPATLAGLAGLMLRVTLYRVGFDLRGMLPRMHPLQLGCVLLALAAALGSLLLIKKQDLGYRPTRFLHPLGRGLLAPVVCVFLLLHVWDLFALNRHVFSAPDALGILTLARMALALAAAASVLIILWLPPRNAGVNLGCHSFLCLFFTVDMLCRYHQWSGNPQLPDYLLQIFACICFTFCSYCRMAFSGQIQKPRLHGFTAIMGLTLGLMCVGGPDTPAFYLAGAVWCAAGLCFSANAQEAV